MKKLLVVLMLALLFPALSSGADDGFYVAGNAGFTFVKYPALKGGLDPDSEWALDNGEKYAVAVGYGFGDLAALKGLGSVRLEGQLSWNRSERDRRAIPEQDRELVGMLQARKLHGKRTILSFMVNGYYDFDIVETLTPFVTAGLGYSSVSSEELIWSGEDIYTDARDDDSQVVTYQIGIGLAIIDTEKLLLDVTYRYFAAFEDVKVTGMDMEVELKNHETLFGVRYKF